MNNVSYHCMQNACEEITYLTYYTNNIILFSYNNHVLSNSIFTFKSCDFDEKMF